jgi:hypothetical protein
MPRRVKWSRCLLAATALLCAGALAARAQNDVVERQLKAVSGRDARAGIYTDVRSDCSSGPLPAIRLAVAPAHGSVTVKRGTLKATNLKQCLAIEAPAYVAFYRAAAGFSGVDIFELEITTPDGRKRRERVNVTVATSPNAGPAI